MRIIVDLQCCQGAGRFRGIGRYVLNLTKAMIQSSPEDEFWLVLSDAFPESEEGLLRAFDTFVPKNRMVTLAVPSPVAFANTQARHRRIASEFIREHFLASLEPDVLYVGSVFEGFGEELVTSIGLSVENRPTVATLFDLIPLIRPHQYLSSPLAQQWFEEKIGHLQRADLMLAISNSTRNEALTFLGVSPHQ